VVAAGAGGVGVEDTMVAAVQCGGTVDMMNIDSHAPTCPLFIWCCVRGGPLPQERQAPPIRAHDGNLP
jgi:hypothetical protein